MRGWGRFIGRSVLLLAVLAGTVGCETLFGGEKDHSTPAGERLSVGNAGPKIAPDPGLAGTAPSLPQAAVNADWAQAGGAPAHVLPHPALGPRPREAWRVSIGEGSDGDFRLLATPVVAGGRVFTLDSRGLVAAFAARNGERLWHVDTTPKGRDDEAMGGGLAVADGVLYATTGFGEVLALKVADGAVLWRRALGKPFRSAPTVAQNRVLVVSLDNDLTALSTAKGETLWQHSGLAESAALMGSASPAATEDSVLVAYSSGEVFNLRAENGRVAWTDVLSVPVTTGALPAMSAIRGLPVMTQGRVFALSHSGPFVAIDQRTGERAWEVELGGSNTPVVAGDAVFALGDPAALVALSRDSGRVFWVRELPRLKDPADRESGTIFWQGPLLAGGRLWVTNSLGRLLVLAPETGATLTEEKAGESFFLPPVVADGTLYLLDDSGHLGAWR